MTKRNNSKKEINYEMLEEKETEYKNQIESKINNTENIALDSLINIMKQSAIETVGMRKKIKKGYEVNNEIQHLSTMQKEIRIKINTTNNTINKAKWKSERNKILFQIRKLCKNAYEKCLEKQLQLMEKSRDDEQTFQAMKFIYRKIPEKLFFNDQENKQIFSETEAEIKIKQFYHNKFYKLPNHNQNPMLQQSLNDPTSFNEVKLAISKLNNNKAKGEDEIPFEMIKYSGKKLIKELSRILNLIVENKIQEDSFIGSGILVTVQKQGNPKGQLTSLRPITLLNTI